MLRSVLVCVFLLLSSVVAAAEEVELVSGEVLVATSVDRGELVTVIDHPILGRLEVATSQIVEIRGEPTAPHGASTPQVPDHSTAADPPVVAEDPSAWKWKAELGANGSTGNTETLDLRTAVEALLETEEHRFKFGSTYLLGRTDGDRTKHQFRATGTKDWLVPGSPWLVFGRARYDWDEFQEWESRVGLGGGAGYDLIKTETDSVIGRAGLNAVREFGGGDEEWRLEALLGLEGDWKLSDTQGLEASLTVFPDLGDSGEYRSVLTAAWSVRLDTVENLHLKLGFENEYDSHREDPFETNDFKYFIALLLEF